MVSFCTIIRLRHKIPYHYRDEKEFAGLLFHCTILRSMIVPNSRPSSVCNCKRFSYLSRRHHELLLASKYKRVSIFVPYVFVVEH